MLEIPVPAGNIEILWLLLGMSFGRSFGKKLDYTIQEDPWFKKQSASLRWLMKSILDFTHHWWIGALIWIYAPLFVKWWFWPSLLTEITWFGVGLFFDDIRDYKNIIRRYQSTNGTEIT